MRISGYTALAAMLMSASGAIAQQFVEFQVQARAGNDHTSAHHYTASFVVRANDPTQTPIPSTVSFTASTPGEIRSPETLDASITFFGVGEGGLVFDLVATLDTGPATFDFRVWEGGPDANANGSIPNNPDNYRGWFRGLVLSETPAGDAPNISWRGDTGFSAGSFALSVRNVPDPEPPQPEGCSVADLAEPYGLHDFSDVVAFLSAFGAGCP